MVILENQQPKLVNLYGNDFNAQHKKKSDDGDAAKTNRNRR